MQERFPSSRIPEKLTTAEALEVLQIVDLGPKHLDKITPENVDAVLAAGTEELKRHAEEVMILSPEETPANAFEKALADPSSLCHAVVCSLQRAEDVRLFSIHLDQFIEKAKINRENKSVGFIRSFLERHRIMNELLTKLYLADIARRIGIAKDEERFIRKGFGDFGAIGEEIETTLTQFEKGNKDKLAASPDVAIRIGTLRENITAPNYESFKNDFYEAVCENYSRLAFTDFEEYNERDLRKALEMI